MREDYSPDGSASTYLPHDHARSRAYRWGEDGGNSNWRGPIWFPINYLLIETLQKYHYYAGEALTVEEPAGSGNTMSLWDAANAIAHRLIGWCPPNKLRCPETVRCSET